MSVECWALGVGRWTLGVHFFSISVFSISAFLFHSRYGVGWDTGLFFRPAPESRRPTPASAKRLDRAVATGARDVSDPPLLGCS
jgi:hypothetical protein